MLLTGHSLIITANREPSPSGESSPSKNSARLTRSVYYLRRWTGSATMTHVFNEIRTLFLFFQSCKDHLSSNDVLFGVDQVFIHVLVRPNDARVFVRLRICK